MSERGLRVRMETDRKIRQAALDIALSTGTDAITIKGISRRSGVATTTIYRRYRNTRDLLRNLFMPSVVASPEFAELKPSKTSLGTLVRGLAEYLESTIGVRSVGAVAASDSLFFRKIVETIVTPAKNKVQDYFNRGVRMGVFKPDLNVELILDLVIGATVAHSLLHGEVTLEWTTLVTEYLWPAISAS